VTSHSGSGCTGRCIPVRYGRYALPSQIDCFVFLTPPGVNWRAPGPVAERGVASPARKIAVRWASHVPVYSASGILLPVL